MPDREELQESSAGDTPSNEFKSTGRRCSLEKNPAKPFQKKKAEKMKKPISQGLEGPTSVCPVRAISQIEAVQHHGHHHGLSRNVISTKEALFPQWGMTGIIKVSPMNEETWRHNSHHECLGLENSLSQGMGGCLEMIKRNIIMSIAKARWYACFS